MAQVQPQSRHAEAEHLLERPAFRAGGTKGAVNVDHSFLLKATPGVTARRDLFSYYAPIMDIAAAYQYWPRRTKTSCSALRSLELTSSTQVLAVLSSANSTVQV